MNKYFMFSQIIGIGNVFATDFTLNLGMAAENMEVILNQDFDFESHKKARIEARRAETLLSLCWFYFSLSNTVRRQRVET